MLEVYLEVKGGKILECRVCGDFMALLPAGEVEKRLTGYNYKYEDVLSVLDELTLPDYFGTITKKEVASCICCIGE